MNIIQTQNHELISELNREVQDIHAQMYPNHFKEYDQVTISAFFKSIMTKPNFQFYVIEEQEQKLGYIWIEIREYQENPFRKSYKAVYIHQLTIIKAYRNKGLGKKLLNKVYEIAVQNKINKIEVDYWAKNEVARNFYNKNEYVAYREFRYKDL
ncbi:GCN5-related N-acetyltransferase [Paenibacillus vortex V453]|uniref:GCN5-related N-acetyltransferase n=1 Tax=Paenibacillus vortex V453 TaxID=715225 RepID=A0A2R9SUE5_9BACL|nr:MULTISPECIES: GNAT family N-acetyltransferase [Paenibacillus]AWP28102.1 N-acetyltransferase [Paenibacillus sp. Cedars]EFU40999.1 GCN5-related N-acetyltransferase [Paenibacillus vortex V453]